MGIGWEYFNNVCLAIKVAQRAVASIVGLVALWLVGSGVMQYINANRTDPTLIVQPTTTPADAPAAKPNPQFKALGNGATAPPAAGVPAAGALGVKPNPQFQQPGTTVPANVGTSAAPADMKPNPQFAPNPQFREK